MEKKMIGRFCSCPTFVAVSNLRPIQNYDFFLNIELFFCKNMWLMCKKTFVASMKLEKVCEKLFHKELQPIVGNLYCRRNQ